MPTASGAVAADDGAAMALPADEEWELVIDVARADAADGHSLDEYLAPVAAEIAVQDLNGDERTALASILRAELDAPERPPVL